MFQKFKLRYSNFIFLFIMGEQYTNRGQYTKSSIILLGISI